MPTNVSKVYRHLACSQSTHTLVRHEAFGEGVTMMEYVDRAVLAYTNRPRRSGEDG